MVVRSPADAAGCGSCEHVPVRVGSLHEQNQREGQLGEQPEIAGVDTEVEHPETDGSERQPDAHEHQRAAHRRPLEAPGHGAIGQHQQG